MVHATATVHTTRRTFSIKNLSPCADKDPERLTATSNKDYNKFIYKPQKSWQIQRLEREPYSSAD
jgi:hypothetical protein